jgi:AcrR family transcriptional regulator
MTKSDMDARESIMEATMGLIREHDDGAKITIRDIASRANVGIGLINYHFQTKENLINKCVQRMIGSIIEGFDPLYKSLKMKPMDKLIYLIKLNADFLVSNIGISSISITNDIISGNSSDNTVQTIRAYFPVLKEVYGDKKTDDELGVILHILISSVQTAFLRRNVIRETEGIDFLDKKQRDKFIDKIIENIF